jgi:hypothetical protein
LLLHLLAGVVRGDISDFESRGASKESLDEEGIRRSGGRLARTCREWIDRERESVADGAA